MSKLTGTHSEVGAYEFTTLTTVPGVIQYKGAKIQVCILEKTRKKAQLLILMVYRFWICPVLSKVPRTAKVVVDRSLLVCSDFRISYLSRILTLAG